MHHHVWIKHHLSSCIIKHLHVSSCIIMQHHVSSSIIMYASSIIIYHHASSSIIMFHHVSSYIIKHHHVSSCIIIHYQASSCIIIYHHASSYIIMHNHVLSFCIISLLLTSSIQRLHHSFSSRSRRHDPISSTSIGISSYNHHTEFCSLPNRELPQHIVSHKFLNSKIYNITNFQTSYQVVQKNYQVSKFPTRFGTGLNIQYQTTHRCNNSIVIIFTK
jgi:hypothetical protein